MSLQDSTFNTAHVQDNEIVKANDFEFAFENLITNVSKATQMFLEANQDFVINGKVLPYQGMNVQVSPIFGVCKSTGIPFGRTETAIMEYGFDESSSGRIDIIEVKGDWEEYDEQQRAFNDPDTDTQTYQYVNTKKLMRPVYQIKKGVEGSSVAPEVDSGYVKLAEVVIRANSSSILATDIKNITSDVAGEDNENWTTQQDITYNIGYISDVNARFRVQHNADGTHKDDVINSDSLDIGTGEKQINGNILPIGGTVSIPEETIATTDSILSVIVKAAAMLTSLYNAYLKFGNNSFKGTVSISSIADANNNLTKPISITAAGDGTAVIKIDGNAVLSIDANGKLSTNGYTASSNNHLVTKAVTDAISTAVTTLAIEVNHIEQTLADNKTYVNELLSRYSIDYTNIAAATTANINTSGSQTIDGVTLTNGQFVLVKNQNDAKQNGIYTYSSTSAWNRTTAFDSESELKFKIFIVANGSANKGKMFYIPLDSFTVGTSNIPFKEFFGSVAAKSGKIAVRNSSGKLEGDITGNAATATSATSATSAGKWTTARDIKISDADGTNTGDAVSVDGSANKTLKLPATIKASLSGNASSATTATSAGKLTTARKTYVALGTASTTTTRDWSGDTTIPVDGKLAIANGGTNATTAAAARTNLGLGSAATKTAGSAAANVPIVGTALGTTDNNIVVTDTSGQLKPFGKTPNNIAYWGNGGAVCSTAMDTAAKTAAIPGFALYTGVTVKIMFTNGNSNAAPTLDVNSTGAKSIKVVKAGQKIAPPTHSGKWRGASSATTEAWQPLTTLELMYDGTDWVIIGNPVVEDYYTTTGGYTVKANGLIEQWGDYTKNATTNDVTFSVTFSQSNPAITCQPYGSQQNASNYIGVVYSFNNSKFRIDTLWGETEKFSFYWKATGY